MGAPGSFFEIKVNHIPALLLASGGTKLNGQTKEAQHLRIRGASPRGTTFEVGTKEVPIAFGNNDFGGAVALGVEAIEGIVNFKANPVRMGVLAIPFAVPEAPNATGLQVHQFPGFGIRFKRTVARAQVGIGEGQGGNDLPTVGTTNFRTKDRVVRAG